ncbi:MAG: S8 family serine peptidase [Bacteroidetes bacterium]|nr:S8 family serine peptidase [Bacteroidota bacterium]
MNSLLLLILFLLYAGHALSQVAPNRFWIRFADKNNSAYSLTQPEQFLSQRAIERRTKFNITVTDNDLPVNDSYVVAVKNLGVKILNCSKWFNSVTIDTAGCNDPAVLDKISALPFVEGFSPVGMAKKISEYSPLKNEKNLPVVKKEVKHDENNEYDIHYKISEGVQWEKYGDSYTQVSMVNGHTLHERNFLGQGMVIAVIDAGFYKVDILSAFDSLRAQGGIIATKDFVDLEDSVYEDGWHGMQVLSALAGNLPGQLIGSAPKAKYLLLRSEAPAENPIEEINWASAAEYADSAGADILSTSLGYSVFDDTLYNHSYADLNGDIIPISSASDMAASKGMMVICAAGNEGNDEWQYITAPADGDSVMAVGAVDATAVYASFSSKGPAADGRIKPDIAAMGKGTTVASPYGGITKANGTSVATPLISGFAACLWQANPAASNMEIYRAIIKSANQYFNPDTLLGYGIPDLFDADLLLKGINPDSVSADKLISLFPNPFNRDIIITFYSNSSQVIRIELTDLTGRVILSGSNKVSVKTYNPLYLEGLSFLPGGIYLMRIVYSTGTNYIKLIKQ